MKSIFSHFKQVLVSYLGACFAMIVLLVIAGVVSNFFMGKDVLKFISDKNIGITSIAFGGLVVALMGVLFGGLGLLVYLLVTAYVPPDIRGLWIVYSAIGAVVLGANGFLIKDAMPSKSDKDAVGYIFAFLGLITGLIHSLLKKREGQQHA